MHIIKIIKSMLKIKYGMNEYERIKLLIACE